MRVIKPRTVIFAKLNLQLLFQLKMHSGKPRKVSRKIMNVSGKIRKVSGKIGNVSGKPDPLISATVHQPGKYFVS